LFLDGRYAFRAREGQNLTIKGHEGNQINQPQEAREDAPDQKWGQIVKGRDDLHSVQKNGLCILSLPGLIIGLFITVFGRGGAIMPPRF
jgi:hypothetical protein